MKGLNLFLAMFFVVPLNCGAVADVVKTATRVSSGRGQLAPSVTTRNTTASKQRTVTTTPRTATNKNILHNIVSRTKSTTPIEQNRTSLLPRDTSVVARTAKKTSTTARSAIQSAKKSASRSNISRAATVQTRESVMQRDFSKCKSVFFDCMDEFCANKDTQLKRCACSTRANEFRTTQKSLDNIEDKLLDFSQLLLKVNMDPSDAAVINQETVGEKAYNETKDKTESKKVLDEIAEKLNTKFDSAGGTDMSALSWSLNADAAFDSVDSLSGAATTAKSGTALRNAALPICREMAAEICSEDDISLVENSYNMSIEQDCNTVKKAYETQTQQAKSKILESSALLDMTRLNNYQTNNSDDILTCKSKMLELLYNTNVCGENLTKCLDISGRYINPTTGEAFLSNDLINISTLITRPANSDSWANMPANSSFVSYLNAKKKYLESATKNCQTIADDVWGAFLEDALAQIKLAQNAKLEEVRQSCTTLLTECLDNAKESLSEFDSRALSTFGVITDKTANALCAKIKSSCSAVIDYDVDTGTTIAGNAITPNWSTGARDIAALETYNTIITTCREIGRNCIINSCKSISGNFGLCESLKESVNRHSILTRRSCWDDVYNCVAQASNESIENIHTLLPNYNSQTAQNLYTQMYSNAINDYNTYTQSTQQQQSNTPVDVYDICGPNGAGQCDTTNRNDIDCYRCRITEQIWGNCMLKPDNLKENPILIPNDPEATTLLSWFAKNTHTDSERDSCSVSICPAGKIDYTINTSVLCEDASDILQCPSTNILCRYTERITTPASTTNAPQENCCPSGLHDAYGNCCMDSMIDTTNSTNFVSYMNNTISNTKICTPSLQITTLIGQEVDNNGNGTGRYILCGGTVSYGTNNQVICSGQYFAINNNNNQTIYENIDTSNNNNTPYSVNYFINVNFNDANYCSAATGNDSGNICVYSGANGNWTGANCPTNSLGGKWLVKF